MNFSRIFLLSIVLASGGFAKAVAAGDIALQELWETGAGLKNPESVIYDPKRDVLYVSNVNGTATEKDKNGFIAKVSLQGEIVELQWIAQELSAPKGMGLFGDKLYVADIDELVEIDLAAGRVSQRWRAQGAVFLNDVAVDAQGSVYVSDMMTDTLYRLQAGRFAPWVTSQELEGPNGLYAERDRLLVATWGPIKEGFSTERGGRLKSVSLADRSLGDLGDGRPVGNLDGLEADGRGSYLVTDWMAGKVLHIRPNGEFEVLLSLQPGTADHEYVAERALVLIPMMKADKLVAYRLERIQ